MRPGSAAAARSSATTTGAPVDSAATSGPQRRRVQVAAEHHVRIAGTHRVVAPDARVEQAPARAGSGPAPRPR